MEITVYQVVTFGILALRLSLPEGKHQAQYSRDSGVSKLGAEAEFIQCFMYSSKWWSFLPLKMMFG